MRIIIKSKKQAFATAAFIGVIAIVVSNLLTYIFESIFSPPYLLQDMIVSTIVPAIAGPLISYLLFRQSLDLYRLNQVLQQEIKTRQRMESQLKQANAEALAEKRGAEKARRIAEAANQAKSTFLANMSHELRTPLNAILGFSRMMGRNPRFPEDEIESLTIIQKSGEHLLSLINQILDLSKIEAGQQSLNPTEFDPRELLNEIEEVFSLQVAEKALAFTVEHAPELPGCIRTDALKLRQVLINLLNNAIKFTAEGWVCLRIALNENGQSDNAVRLVFEVEDSGPGIIPEEMDKLFEAFVQTETGVRSGEGSGLGLPISKRFVELMGGRLTVQSQVGQGSCFAFDIRAEPVRDQGPGKCHLHRCVLGLKPGHPRYRILIADDIADNRALMIRLLEPMGFEILEAKNGKQALKIWKEKGADLILMDIRMPVMDGYAAVRRIKETQSEKTPPIIAVSASAFAEDRTAVLLAGCDDFLPKPFEESRLFELLGKHLGLRYRYAEVMDDHAKAEDAGTETPLSELLKAVSAELKDQLRSAALKADMAAVEAIIERIGSEAPELADRLRELADAFEYGRISEILS